MGNPTDDDHANAAGEVIRDDLGGWISGPSLSMTTLQKLAAALAVPCDVHQVPAGEPCPLVELQACMARRTAALDGES